MPDRIGHGVRSVEDPVLVAHLAEKEIPLEVSPVSNVATGVYRSLSEHPFRVLRDAGVTVTLNSDYPPMFGAWLADVYRSAGDAWDYEDDSLAEIARTAFELPSPTTISSRRSSRASIPGSPSPVGTERRRYAPPPVSSIVTFSM